jgi:hypothetical protein
VKHEQAKEQGAGECASVSKSDLSGITCGTQWESPRTAAILLPQLPDVLWGNARHADV